MFLRWYRKRIAKQVEDKMYYMCTCPNERDVILHIIAPKDFGRCEFHCNKDCNHINCISYSKGVNK